MSLIAVSVPQRHQTLQAQVKWGPRTVLVGGGAPVVVQSMTNTDTEDVIGTAIQVKELAQAGSEVVRITVNTLEAARAVPAIRSARRASSSARPGRAGGGAGDGTADPALGGLCRLPLVPCDGP